MNGRPRKSAEEDIRKGLGGGTNKSENDRRDRKRWKTDVLRSCQIV